MSTCLNGGYRSHSIHSGARDFTYQITDFLMICQTEWIRLTEGLVHGGIALT